MAYCVNCGTELQKGTKICPLCGVESVNPLEKTEEEIPLYPKTPLGKSEKPKSRFQVLWIVSLLLAVPVLATTVSDFFSDGKWTWSAYVLVSMAFFYILTVFPFFFKKQNTVLFLSVDFLSLLLFLFLLDHIGGTHWFFPFGLLLAGGVGLLILAVVSLFLHADLSREAKISLTFLAAGFCTLYVELLITTCFDISFVGWSLYTIIACIVFAAVAAIIDRSPAIKNEIKKRFFF